jgi:hypothetical protein
MKIILHTIFSVIISLLLVNNVSAFTERELPEGSGENGWTAAFFCDSANNRVSFKDFQAVGRVQLKDKSEINPFIEDTFGYCLDPTKIGAFYDYNYNPLNLLQRDIVWYCPIGYEVKRDPVNTAERINDDTEPCCPNDKPFGYNVGVFSAPDMCCDRAGLSTCDSSNGVVPVEDKESPTEADGVFYFEAEILYTCAMSDCLFQYNEPATGTVKRGTYEDPLSEGLQCYKNQNTGDFDTPGVTITPYDSSGYGQFYCIGGTALTPDEFDKWFEEGKLNAYIACKDFKDPETGEPLEEFNRCIQCIDDCDTCVYSALGCIDTTLNGVITTIMRIGLGVLGAVGILRIMQAAMLRQSADPKDIQESWDIIMSVIMGAIVLVASSLILRVIGVNILGILPFDF